MTHSWHSNVYILVAKPRKKKGKNMESHSEYEESRLNYAKMNCLKVEMCHNCVLDHDMDKKDVTGVDEKKTPIIAIP